MNININSDEVSSVSSELTDDSDEGEEYIVEKILDRRHHRGEVQYLVKWLNYSDEDNTWELASDLDCPTLVNSFESKFSLKRALNLNNLYEKKAKRMKIDPCLVMDNPFNHGFTAQEVLKGFKKNGEVSFLIKFLDLDQPQMVLSGIAYEEIPQMVLKFYEKQCNFQDYLNNYIS
ncbi:chromobox protein homolog 5 [Drosophila takahashii]|uniref:chromobox protein homolog 5 n=1 Tax=Drosophila takahashii TaxID=29030 RepID=UPI001CF89A07|nr:chromobox protein homolog 5 [Drosophila takahashii]